MDWLLPSRGLCFLASVAGKGGQEILDDVVETPIVIFVECLVVARVQGIKIVLAANGDSALGWRHDSEL